METEQITDDGAPAGAPDGQRRSLDGLGLGAVVTGILLLSPLAIVLGHLSLRRVKKDGAPSRTLGLAGLVLGYLGLAVTIAAVVAYVTVLGPGVDRATADARAQADVTAIGNQVAQTVDPGLSGLPDVQALDGTYVVGTSEVEAQLGGERTVELSGTSPTQWCVELGYEGGESTIVSYVSTDGFHPEACG